ncbi:MAG: eamA-like transporter family protein, partial [Firmicutes bacterium]|nr:eamA-like transporter family protein [Bacillota bacterium]
LELMLLTVVLIWAANQTIGKLAMREISPQVYTTLRFLLAAPLMLLVLKWREGNVAFDRALLPRLIVIGFIGVSFYQTVFISALKYTSVTNLALMMGISPLFTVLLGAATGQEKLRSGIIGGCLVAFGGLVMVLRFGPIQSGAATATLIGDGLALAASFLWGLYPVIVMPLLKKHSGLWVTAWSSVPGTIILLFISSAELLSLPWQAISSMAWFAVVFAAIPVTVFSLLVWYWGVERIGANQVMVYMYLVPPASIAIAYFAIGEQVGFWQLVGGAVAMIGLFWVKRTASR